MASGFVPSVDGSEIYLYASGQPFTHGGDSVNQTWRENTGIGILRLRRDGFVSLDAKYGFYGSSPDLYPQFTTTPFLVPAAACPTGTTLYLAVNVKTSVVGFIQMEVQTEGKALPTYELAKSDRITGNTLGARASWGSGNTTSLQQLAGKEVTLRVAMADASLYSISVKCAEGA